MTIASHLILSFYGFWLPNDPRGSWSEFVRSWDLYQTGGKATQVRTKASVAATPHDHDERLKTKATLQFPAVVLTGEQARAVGRGLARAVADGDYQVQACAILPEHVHLVVRIHERSWDRIVQHLKSAATLQLAREGIHPLYQHRVEERKVPSPWARGYWKVFLGDERALSRATRYVEENPVKEGKPRQTWSFVAK